MTHKIVGDRILPISKFSAVTTQEFIDSRVFDGVVFALSKRIAIASESVNDIVIDGTGIDSNKSFVAYPISFAGYDAGPIDIDVYICAECSDDGTEIESINRDNEIMSSAAQAKIYLNPTVSDVGTKMPIEFTLFSNGSPANFKLGGEVRDNFIFKLRKDVKYLIRCTNTIANVGKMVFAMNWMESS